MLTNHIHGNLQKFPNFQIFSHELLENISGSWIILCFCWEIIREIMVSWSDFINERLRARTSPWIFGYFWKCSKIAEFCHVGFVLPERHCSVVFFRWVAFRFGEITYAKKALFLAASFCRTRNKRNLLFCGHNEINEASHQPLVVRADTSILCIKKGIEIGSEQWAFNTLQRTTKTPGHDWYDGHV